MYNELFKHLKSLNPDEMAVQIKIIEEVILNLKLDTRNGLKSVDCHPSGQFPAACWRCSLGRN
jgi:hypothetical protein